MTDTGNPLKKWALYVYLGANVPEAPVREAAVESLLQMATVGSSGQVPSRRSFIFQANGRTGM